MRERGREREAERERGRETEREAERQRERGGFGQCGSGDLYVIKQAATPRHALIPTPFTEKTPKPHTHQNTHKIHILWVLINGMP